MELHQDLLGPNRTITNTTSNNIGMTDIVAVDSSPSSLLVYWLLPRLPRNIRDLLDHKVPYGRVINSPLMAIYNEHYFVAEVITRLITPSVRRALRACDLQLSVVNGDSWPGNRVEGKPEMCIVKLLPNMSSKEDKVMVLPVEVKLSVNWRSVWKDSPNPDEVEAYK